MIRETNSYMPRNTSVWNVFFDTYEKQENQENAIVTFNEGSYMRAICRIVMKNAIPSLLS